MKVELLLLLKESVDPYLFFWQEWSANGNCNLSTSEISLVNKYIKHHFRNDIIGHNVTNYDEIFAIKTTIRKLERGYQIFKDFVIVNFLHKIIVTAREYGYDAFLTQPIHQLDIDEDLKKCLLKFKTHNLQLAFLINKPEDCNMRALFSLIQEFQTIKKKNLITINKPNNVKL